MRFVTVTHPDVGETRVAKTTVPHLPDGWTVTDAQPEAETLPADDSTLDPPAAETETAPPTTRATRARTSSKES